jgi:hypothetical protein
MTKPTGIVADGYDRYVDALDAEASARLSDLQKQLIAEKNAARRAELEAEMKKVRAELAEKRRNAAGSLF